MMHLGGMSVHTVWQQYFTEDMMQYVTNCSNHYAHKDCNDPNSITTPTEIRKFCGILLLSEYHEVPHISH